jgi:peptide-methionine (S)-S-oxide reductase
MRKTFMSNFPFHLCALFEIMMLAMIALGETEDRANVAFPSPALDVPLSITRTEQSAVLAGGCFWGTQAVFEHVKGVIKVTSGYSGGAADTADYKQVSAGRTGHAEAIKIIYDASKIKYGQLLKVFFSGAHDPTQLNRQGPDNGTQYRSAIFYADDEQKRIADAYIGQLEKANVFKRPIVTQVVPLSAFYPAEAYHQDYVMHHPHSLYVVLYDKPKLSHLRREIAELYADK